MLRIECLCLGFIAYEYVSGNEKLNAVYVD